MHVRGLSLRYRGLLWCAAAGAEVFAEASTCEHGAQPYHDAPEGDNVWEYFFLQPGSHRLRLDQLGQPGIVRSVQVG